MNTPIGLEQCFSFINCNLHPAKSPLGKYTEPSRYRAVTISRQSGSGGHSVAEKLLEHLQAHETEGGRPWAIFDRNLVEKVLEDHNLPARLAKFMPENRVSEISSTMDELFGLHPPSWELVRKTSETILHLAQLEHVILIGRGSNIITSRLPHVFHVRLVGSMERRTQRLQEMGNISAKEAVRMADREDLARRRYVKQFFSKDIDDPLLYHLVINTDLLSVEEAARLILQASAPKSLALAA
jgi:cytidylate kinase